MTTTAPIRRNRSSLLHSIAHSTIRTSTVVTRRKKSDNPAGFVSALAHEIRNPLCTINLALEMLIMKDADDEQRQYLGMIVRGTKRIKELVNRLLLQDAAKEVRNEVYSLHQLLEEALAGVRDRMFLNNISVTREYTAAEHCVFLDPERLTIALTNILINAIEAMSRGKGELKLVTRSTDQECSIEIHDNGIGISKDGVQRMFEPFFSNKPGGMGIGLAATLDILRANHTRVDVRSEEGVGTCFVLSFDRI
jgi:signal transduction histidine kinase